VVIELLAVGRKLAGKDIMSWGLLAGPPKGSPQAA